MSDFPNRPDHPDFALLSEIVVALDQAFKDGADYQATLAALIDSDSVTYMAKGRAELALRHNYVSSLNVATFPRSQVAAMIDTARLAATYLDGFVHGCEFTARKAETES